MDLKSVELIQRRVRELTMPEDFHTGRRVPEHFALPDSILFFYHGMCARAPFTHQRYALVFPLGRMHYYVADQEFDISAGDVLILPPNARRFLAPQSASYWRFFITFELPVPQDYMPEKLHLRMTEASELYLQKLFDHYQTGRPAELSMALYGLLNSLVPAGDTAETKRLSREIADVVEFINEKLHMPLTARLLAARVNMSSGNLARRFRNEIGMPLYEYISLQRLELARYYLQKSDKNMEDIALCCGFLSGSSFSHFFVRRTGESPQAYRKKQTLAKD